VGLELSHSGEGEWALSSRTHTRLLRLARPDGGACDAGDPGREKSSLSVAEVFAAPATGCLPTEVDPGTIRLPATTESRNHETSFTPDDGDLLLDEDEDDGARAYSATPKLPKGSFKVGKLMSRITESIKKKGKKSVVVKWKVHWAGYDHSEDSPEFEVGGGHGCPGVKDGMTNLIWLGVVEQFRSQFDGRPEVENIPSNVCAHTHVQCAMKDRCKGQRFYNREDCERDLCEECGAGQKKSDQQSITQYVEPTSDTSEEPHPKKTAT